MTHWSLIVNRIDDSNQIAWKEWRLPIVDTSEGTADAGSIPMLGPEGQLDPSMVPGAEPTQSIILTAGASINAYQGISIHTDGLAYPASADSTTDAGCVVGVAITSTTTGNTFTVQQSGEISNYGFLFTPGATIFLGISGSLVESVISGSAFQQPMGVSVSSTKLLLNIGLPIILN